MATPTIIEYREGTPATKVTPTTVRALGKQEDFLEDLIAANPELLELESNMLGIQGPFVVLRQNDLVNSLDRAIIPDLVIFCSSGQVIIVEVKLSDNPELRDRKVLAQVIDYAGAFVDRSEDELLGIFSRYDQTAETWHQLISAMFPKTENIKIVANRISDRFQRGELHLVVACDKAPPGLSTFLSGTSRQSALPFTLSLVEITPYADSDHEASRVLFVSKAILQTEIVSRTAVTVRYEQGSNERPTVRIDTTPLVEIEEMLAQPSDARYWSEAEIEEAVNAANQPIINKLFKFAKTESNADQIISPGKKQNPVFGYYLRGTDAEGIERTKQVFNYRVGSTELVVYLNMIETITPEAKYNEFIRRLIDIFPTFMSKGLKEPWIPLSDIDESFDEFRSIILSLKE